MKCEIKIIGDNTPVLSVSLKDLLACIENGKDYYWSILWIEATGTLTEISMLEFEREVKKSENGFLINWNDLIKLSNSFYQVIEVLIIGDRKRSNIKRYNYDHKMKKECDFIIELIDSSFWEVTCNNEKTVKNFFEKLEGVTLL